MNELFSQGGKGSTGILTNKQAVARHFGVKQSEVVYFSVGAVLSGYKVIYDKESQRAYSLPTDLSAGTTAVSLSTAGVLVHSAGNVDLGALAVTREEYVTLPGSFDTGVTVNTKNELVTFTDGKYRWDGALPKVVPVGSTPTTTGGIGNTKWLPIGVGVLALETGASNVKTTSGKSVQDYLEGYLSSFNGNLQQAINELDVVYIDEDYLLNSVVTIPSNKKLVCINGSKITHANGGLLTTEVFSSPQYYKDVPGNLQIAITASVTKGATQITVADASSIAIGTKLQLKNGYCDMWRVLESGDAGIQRKAVHSLTFKSEVVEVLGKTGNVLTVTPTIYDYPLTPTVYGYVANENALPEYTGWTRPSVTKILYENIYLDLNIVLPATSTSRVMTLAYVDGLDFKMKLNSEATIHAPFVITASIVNIHDVETVGHTGGILWVQETSKGNIHNLIAKEWNGGHDSPFIAMLLSNFTVNGITVEAAVKQVGASAYYINTCDGSNVSGVSGYNLPKVFDASFSRHVVANGLFGKNCDLVVGAFASSSCTFDNGIVDGYCLQDSSTTIYIATLLYCLNTTNNQYSNIKRLNDLGYGRIRIGGTINCRINNVQAPETTVHIVIANKATEVAQGADSIVCQIADSNIGGFVKESTYYDAADEYGYSYPRVNLYSVTIKNGGTIQILGGSNQADSYNLYSTSVAELGAGIFGISITGILGGITVSASNKNTCYPYIRGLKLIAKPATGVFQDVDSMITAGTLNSASWMYNANVSDVYSLKSYTNKSAKGTAASWAAY